MIYIVTIIICLTAIIITVLITDTIDKRSRK